MVNSESCTTSRCPFYEPGQPMNCGRSAFMFVNECDIRKTIQADPLWAENVSNPLYYVRFSFVDYWCHIGPEEVFAVWNDEDLAAAVKTFKQRHEHDGDVMVFRSIDGVEWEIDQEGRRR